MKSINQSIKKIIVKRDNREIAVISVSENDIETTQDLDISIIIEWEEFTQQFSKEVDKPIY